MKRDAFLSMLWLAFASAGLSAENSEPFRYAGEDGYQFELVSDGISIHLGDQLVASGRIRAIDATPWFNASASPILWIDSVQEKLESASDNRASIKCEQTNLSSTVDLLFQGQDVLVKARLENNSDQIIEAVGIEFPAFRFNREPKGHMPSWDIHYVQRVGAKLAHPSHFVRLGGTHASDDQFGVGATPWKTGIARSLLLWDPPNASNSHRGLRYLVPGNLPPGGAITIQMILRVSRHREWKHLLQPYQKHFQQTVSTIQYAADHRPFVQFSSVDKTLVASNNPFGFNGNSRRFDTVGGTLAFGRMVLPGLIKSQSQGVMFWALGGYDQRGAMYRPDFDVFPKEIEDNLPLLRKLLSDEGKVLGLCTRPGEIAIRADRDHDMTLPINVDDSAHLEMMKKRFERAINMGFTAFYLDSFGCTLEDVKTMIFLRKQLGRSIQTYAEMPCDWLLPYSGAYVELAFDAKTNQYVLPWLGGMEFWEYLRYLVPDVGSMAQKRVDEKVLPSGLGSVDELLYQNHLTPLSEDWRIGKDAERLRTLNERYLDNRGQWRK